MKRKKIDFSILSISITHTHTDITLLLCPYFMYGQRSIKALSKDETNLENIEQQYFLIIFFPTTVVTLRGAQRNAESDSTTRKLFDALFISGLQSVKRISKSY